MKAISELEGMTKAQLDEYALNEFGADLSGLSSKPAKLAAIADLHNKVLDSLEPFSWEADEYPIEGTDLTVTKRQVLECAFMLAAVSPADWNGLTQDERDAFATEAFAAITAEHAPPPPDPPVADSDGGTDSGEHTEPPPSDEPEPQPVEVTADAVVTVTVTEFTDTSGVPLLVNGRRFNLPIGKPVPIPAWAVLSLAAVGGCKFTVKE